MVSRGNILIVEQDPMVREALGRALALDDYCAIPAADHAEAVSKFRDQPVHALILDLHPRKGDPLDTARALTALQPSLPVVAMTALPERHTAPPRLCNALVEKPLDLPCLVQLLKDLV